MFLLHFKAYRESANVCKLPTIVLAYNKEMCPVTIRKLAFFLCPMSIVIDNNFREDRHVQLHFNAKNTKSLSRY